MGGALAVGSLAIRIRQAVVAAGRPWRRGDACDVAHDQCRVRFRQKHGAQVSGEMARHTLGGGRQGPLFGWRLWYAAARGSETVYSASPDQRRRSTRSQLRTSPRYAHKTRSLGIPTCSLRRTLPRDADADQRTTPISLNPQPNRPHRHSPAVSSVCHSRSRARKPPAYPLAPAAIPTPSTSVTVVSESSAGDRER